VASNGTADTPQVLHSAPRPSLEGAKEESPKRVASDAQSPAGPPEGAVFGGLFGRAKSSPPEAECPEGEKARAAGPERTTPGGRKSAGRRPRKNNARRAKRNISKNGPGRMALKKHFRENNTWRGKRNVFKKKPGRRPKKTLSVKKAPPEGGYTIYLFHARPQVGRGDTCIACVAVVMQVFGPMGLSGEAVAADSDGGNFSTGAQQP